MTDKAVTILAIDDDQDILFTLEAIGRTYGWRVTTDSDGRRAAAKVCGLKPDLILVDYHMPGLDGLSTVEMIRTQDRGVPIIVLTVDERQEIADRFLDAGANDFANKPIKIADLAARIKVHIQMRQQQEQLAPVCDKGINDATLSLVRSFCGGAAAPFSAEEVAEGTGLAYQTIVRYLQFLQSRRELTVSSSYGKVGRPRKKYQWVTKRGP
ncbi:two-component system response regulator [Anaeroselena agilis]|uniref:Response regulator n=1 Tax=Anaeroselena agilis TaxID=3063788 RepID=A0ABU3P1U5_9FIRM|nr:response regulator [Selenomonadales bacterium 4137-cl]